jgi:RNA polymerase sigma-70 factor (ECF subfamily)
VTSQGIVRGIARETGVRLRPSFDADVLAAAQRGEAWACRAFVREHQDAVFALAWRILGRAGRGGQAEDVAQEAFVRALRSLPRFDPAGVAKLSTWVLTIATRTIIDELRRRSTRHESLDAVAGELVDPARPDIDIEHQRLGRAIADAVDGLGPEVRAAFVLRAYHDLSYPEIAAALGVDIGTVKSRLFRARQALQARLHGGGW